MQESSLSPKICFEFPQETETPEVCFLFLIAVIAFVALPTFPTEKRIMPQHVKDAPLETDLEN